MSLARRISNLVFAIGQAAVPALGYAGLYGKTVDAQFQTITTPVVPADYAFSIWGLIFLLSIIYAIDQARAARADDPLYQRIGWLTAAAFLANTAWSLVAQQEGPLLLTGLIFLVTLFTVLPAAGTVFAMSQAGDARYLPARLAVGTLAGWVTVAIFANWSVIMQDVGLGEVPGRELQALVFLCAAGATAAVMVMRTRGSLIYALTIGWALAAVAIADVQRGVPVVAVGAGLWLGAIGLLTLVARRRTAMQASPQPLV